MVADLLVVAVDNDKSLWTEELGSGYSVITEGADG